MIEALRERQLPEGGFGGHMGEAFRPDATAWALMALEATGATQNMDSSRQKLVQAQLRDGRVPLHPDEPGVIWPTADVLLALHASVEYEKFSARARDFLLRTTGRHYAPVAGSPTGHDTSIRAWSWIENTHSWVEPTAMALLALSAVGCGDHERCREGRQMLLDRQIPSGGWNYGNKTVFKTELRPNPESTAMALHTLAGYAEPEIISKSLAYLRQEVARAHSPLSLGWSILALQAWNQSVDDKDAWIDFCWNQQKTSAPYDTAWVALLILAKVLDGGLLGKIAPKHETVQP